MADHDAPALSFSLTSHYEELLRFLRRKLGNSELAADVAQETFLRLVRIEQSTTPHNVRAYLFRAASNLLIDTFRRNSRVAAYLTSPFETDNNTPSSSPSVEDLYIARERLQRLHAVLHELPPNCRHALLWNRIEGLSHAQIAARLGVSESMVAKYIAQALRQCRNRLAENIR